MSAHRTCQWFVEPAGDVTRSNEIIAKNIQAIEGSFQRCSDNKDHYLWDCTFKQAERLHKGQRSLEIEVHVWNQEGAGQIRRHNFLLKRRNPAVNAVKKQVAKMLTRRAKCLGKKKATKPITE